MIAATREFGQLHSPTEIRLNREEKALEVAFADGAKFKIPAELLRVESPSAEVQGHSPAEKKIVSGRRHVSIMEIIPVGNYAVALKFDDLHDSGIYTWDTLYAFGAHQDALWAEYLKSLEDAGLSRDPK